MRKIYLSIAILFVLVAYVSADFFTNQLPSSCTSNVRVRKSWRDMPAEDRTRWAKTLFQMKQLQGYWKTGNGFACALYDFFVHVHAQPLNSYGWHGTSWFLLAHKYFLQLFESAVIYTAYTNGATMSPPINSTQACSMAQPYWDWLYDYDGNAYDSYCPVMNSAVLNDPLLGSTGQRDASFRVTDGLFGNDQWRLVQPLSSDPYNPAEGTNLDFRLRRYENCGGGWNLVVGPQQTMQAITSKPKFRDISEWLESLPHAAPHIFSGFSMATMYSPDDVVFWFHHCNLDRLYHLWADCHQYEDIQPADMTINQYEAANPITRDSVWLAVNPYTGVAYDVGIDSPINFYWGYYSDSDVFPIDKWPTPRQLWGLGKAGAPGWDGIYYVYGPDQLARTVLRTACTKNTKWTYVNYAPIVTKKRDFDPMMQEISDKFEAKLAGGKLHHEALYEMAEEECESTPKIVFDKLSLAFIKMNNLHPTSFDRMCDKPSQQLKNTGDKDHPVWELVQPTPLWLIVVASIGSALILIFIVTLVIIFIRKRSASTGVDAYRAM